MTQKYSDSPGCKLALLSGDRKIGSDTSEVGGAYPSTLSMFTRTLPAVFFPSFLTPTQYTILEEHISSLKRSGPFSPVKKASLDVRGSIHAPYRPQHHHAAGPTIMSAMMARPGIPIRTAKPR
jgi:hypothetical protein